MANEYDGYTHDQYEADQEESERRLAREQYKIDHEDDKENYDE